MSNQKDAYDNMLKRIDYETEMMTLPWTEVWARAYEKGQKTEREKMLDACRAVGMSEETIMDVLMEK